MSSSSVRRHRADPRNVHPPGVEAPPWRYQLVISAVDAVSARAQTRAVVISVLGPLRVNGRVDVSPRDRVVLAALALHPGDVVSAERLADGLWGDAPPASWQKVVQGAVMRLRRVLGRSAVETTSDGYRLTVPNDDIDVCRFERLAARASSLRAAGDCERAAATFRQA